MTAGVDQLREYVVVPALRHLGPEYATEPAVELLLGTAAHESDGFKAIKQYRGPAMGLWQVEPATHEDVWRWLAFRKELAERVKGLIRRDAIIPPPHDELVGNLFYAAAIARLVYWRRPFRMPATVGVEALAAIWKTHYNTHFGKGKPEDFVRAYRRYVA